MEESTFQKALDVVFRFLGPRPRSVWEVRQRLRRRKMEPEAIEEIISWLVKHGLVDDEAFAAFWVENRESFRPRSKRLLEQELRLRGVSPETIKPHVEELDEEASALRAARRKALSLARADWPTFATKVGGFLTRRGFSYGVAASVTRRLWQERDSDPAESWEEPNDEHGEGEEQ